MPWYVELGWLIAWVLVGALALVPYAIVRMLRRLADKKRALDERFRFDVGVSALGDGPVTLHGTYRRDGRARDGLDKQWIDHQGDRVDISGPLTIIRGSRVRDAKGKRHHELQDGDLVIVKGTASRAGGTSSYREQAQLWKIEADGARKPLEACASKPAARGRPLSPAWLAGILVVSTVVSWAGLRWYGKKQLAKYPVTTNSTELRPLRLSEPAVIAAMMPGSHDRALAYLYGIYKEVIVRSQDNLDARVAILDKLGSRIEQLMFPDNTPREGGPTNCQVAADELNKQSRFEQALARKCGGYPDSYAHHALGHYDRLADARGFWVYGLAAAKDWARIAAMKISDDGRTTDLALWLSEGRYCEVAQLVDLQASEAMHDNRQRRRYEALALDLRWACDAEHVETSDFVPPLAELVRGKAASSSIDYDARTSALRRTLLSTIAPDTARDVHAFRMHAAIIRGDFATARRERDLAAHEKLADVLELREGTYKDSQGPIASPGFAGSRSTPAGSAESIDGNKAAHMLVTTQQQWQYLRVGLLRDSTSVTSHRDAYQRALRLYVADSGLADPAYHLNFVHEVAVIRDVSRAAGDTASVTRWQGILDKHLAALGDPTQVVFAVFRAL